MSVPAGATALVIAGGWAHPATQTGPPTVAALEACGVRVSLADQMEDAAVRLARGVDLLVVHTCRFRMLDARYNDAQRAAHAYRTTPAVRTAIGTHVDTGRPLLALHTAPISFDDWPDWPAIVGATWSWDRSCHPPPGRFAVDVRDDHTVTRGVPSFAVVDELYRFVTPAPDAQVVATADDADGIVQPIAWLHHAGRARVAYDALGHDGRSLADPAHRALLARLVRWLLDDAAPAVVVTDGVDTLSTTDRTGTGADHP